MHPLERRSSPPCKGETEIKELERKLDVLIAQVTTLEASISPAIATVAAAQGAIAVLEFLGKLAKPVLFIGATITAIGVWWGSHKPGG
jgi:hypothetical protein